MVDLAELGDDAEIGADQRRQGAAGDEKEERQRNGLRRRNISPATTSIMPIANNAQVALA